MTVIPAKHTFTIWQGATFREILTLYETMDKTQPRNLANHTAEMIIRKKPNDDSLSNILLTLASSGNLRPSSNGCNISLPTTTEQMGQIILTIDANYTTLDHITWKTAVYDLTIRDANQNVDALLYGAIKVNGV
jgi:hypothetical protein